MVMLDYLANAPHVYLAIVLTVVVSITLHELAHGWAALRLGDQTPVWTGHMTWNPLVHMGPFSIAACLLAGIAWGSMPIDPTRLRGKWGEAIVAAAGPATNLALAFLALTGMGLWLRVGQPDITSSQVQNGLMFLEVFGTTNLLLFAFNLLPVPPLDGSRILANANPGYSAWASNPQNSGIFLVLFIVGALVARQVAGHLSNLAMDYAFWLAG